MLLVEQNVSDLFLVGAETWRSGVNTWGFNSTAGFLLRTEVGRQVLRSHRSPRVCCALIPQD